MDNIKVISIKQNIKNDLCKVLVELSINNKLQTIWYEFDSKYSDFLTIDVSDFIIICLLPFAMENGLNIETKVPVSESLLYKVSNYIIPLLSSKIKEFKKIDIISSPTYVKYNGVHAGTGVSCGVDSFYTILKHVDSHSSESNKNIDTLCLFNVGSFGGGEHGRSLFHERLLISFDVAGRMNKSLFYVDSNLDEFYKGKNFEKTHAFRTLSIPLLFQKYFGYYYFSSSFSADLFTFSNDDPSRYDLFLIPNLCTDNLIFYSVGCETTRLGKVEFICKFDIVREFLNVCIHSSKNCSKCFKCKRTMLEFYLINELDNFRASFDVDYFKQHKDEYLQYAYSKRHDTDMYEIFRALKKRKEFKAKHFFKDKFLIFKHGCGKILRLLKIRK